MEEEFHVVAADFEHIQQEDDGVQEHLTYIEEPGHDEVHVELHIVTPPTHVRISKRQKRIP